MMINEINNDILITLERGSFVTGILYTLSIHGDGKVIYEGKNDVKTIGVKITEIPVEKVKELVDEFSKTNFFELENFYGFLRGMVNFDRTLIKIGDKTKVVETKGLFKANVTKGDVSEKLYNLNNKIDEIANSYQWTGEK